MNEEEYYKNLPKKRMGVGVLFFNDQDQILLVKPVYKDHWSVPGGVVDANESPRKAAFREVREELGIVADQMEFVGVAYYGDTENKGESLQFMFAGGRLSLEQIQAIVVPMDEISEFRFCDMAETADMVNPALAKRLAACMDAYMRRVPVYADEDTYVPED
jgi:8-oxo-dGTP diphosphatase